MTTLESVLAEIQSEKTALEQLIVEFPELKSWPDREVQQMLGSTSPHMSRRSHAMQIRFGEILAMKSAVLLVGSALV